MATTACFGVRAVLRLADAVRPDLRLSAESVRPALDYGGRYNRTVSRTISLELNVGGDFRYDDIGNVGVDHWSQGQLVENVAQNAIKETSLGVYAEVTWQPTDKLRLLGGLRGDSYNFDVTAMNDHSFAGNENDSRASPKIGVAYELTRSAELYGNWGKGFHSNDARGVVNPIRPSRASRRGPATKAARASRSAR